MIAAELDWPGLSLPARIFVYEHVCGGGLTSEPLLLSLRRQGRAMLRAALEDLDRLPGVRVVATLDVRFDPGELPGEIHVVKTPREARRRFLELAREANGTLLVAPETSGLLGRLSRDVIDAGGTLLGSHPPLVDLATDKLKLAAHLAAAGVPSPMARPFETSQKFSGPVVVKPRRGAGSEDVYRFSSTPPSRGLPERELIIAPYVEGIPASVLFLIGRETASALLPSRQHISSGGRLRYLGGSLPLPGSMAARAVALGRRAIECLPGLRGFTGVDLVLSEKNPGEDRVIEINPRLTTSYTALRRLARNNLAGCWLDVWTGGNPGTPRWNVRDLCFTIDGRVTSSTDPHGQGRA